MLSVTREHRDSVPWRATRAQALEVDRALDALENGDVDMPDYYVVVSPETLPTTWKHWWLGVLPRAAPTRVIP